MPSYTVHTTQAAFTDQPQDHAVEAATPGEAVLIVCRTTGARTWNTAILSVIEEPEDEHDGHTNCNCHDDDDDEMPASLDRECAEHDRSFTAEVLAGAR